MRGNEVQRFERTLKRLFDQLDGELEDRWGALYPRHPVRPARGLSANPESDGLFNVGASFSAGYGSDAGKGYVIDLRLATLSRVDPRHRQEIERYVVGRVQELLATYFPMRPLRVVKDGDLFKVIGDLSLSGEL